MTRKNGRAEMHGMRHYPEYSNWHAMKDRCYNPNTDGYAAYGGRGITVCWWWRDSFANFYADMGPKPTPQHSLDRYPDPCGNYDRDNVRWATPSEQASNKPGYNRMLTWRGRTQTITAWSRELDLLPITILARMGRGWSQDEAMTTPAPIYEYQKDKLLTHDGREMTVRDWARELNLHPHSLQSRLNRGWPLERALTRKKTY